MNLLIFGLLLPCILGNSYTISTYRNIFDIDTYKDIYIYFTHTICSEHIHLCIIESDECTLNTIYETEVYDVNVTYYYEYEIIMDKLSINCLLQYFFKKINGKTYTDNIAFNWTIKINEKYIEMTIISFYSDILYIDGDELPDEENDVELPDDDEFPDDDTKY